MVIKTPSQRAEEWSSSDVCQIARISLRQLQWWDEREVVSPNQKGHRRVYLAEEVIGITVIAELRRKGFSLQKIRQVVRFLRREIGRHLSEVLGGESEWHFLTDGESAYLEDRPGRIIELLKKSPQPMFLVSVSDQASRLGEFHMVRSGKKRSQRSENQLTLF